MQAPGRYSNKPCHGTIYAVAESLSVGIKMIVACPGHRTALIDESCGLADGPIAFFPSAYPRSHFNDISAKFVAENDRVIDWPAMIRRPLVKVTSTNSNIGDFQKNFILADRRFGHFPDLYRSFCGSKINNGSSKILSRHEWFIN